MHHLFSPAGFRGWLLTIKWAASVGILVQWFFGTYAEKDKPVNKVNYTATVKTCRTAIKQYQYLRAGLLLICITVYILHAHNIVTFNRTI